MPLAADPSLRKGTGAAQRVKDRRRPARWASTLETDSWLCHQVMEPHSQHPLHPLTALVCSFLLSEREEDGREEKGKEWILEWMLLR